MGKIKEIFMEQRENELMRDKHIDEEYLYEKYIQTIKQEQPIKPKYNGDKRNK